MLQQAHVLACKGGTTVFRGRWDFSYSIDRIGQPADQFTVHYSDFDRDLDRDFDHDFVKRRAA